MRIEALINKPISPMPKRKIAGGSGVAMVETTAPPVTDREEKLEHAESMQKTSALSLGGRSDS